MSTTTRILSATTALFAASTLYFAWAVGVERDRGADFRTSHGAVAGAADRRAAASENGATGVTDAEGSGRSNETPSAESPGLLERLGSLVGGGRKRASREQESELFQKDFERMFSDPATRKQLVEERIPGFRDQFIVLERRLEKPADQWQRFLETVATQAIDRRGGSSICARDVECQKRSLGPEAHARWEQEIRDVLGDADMKQYQTFNYALSERKSVELLQAELPLPQQLSEKAAEDLIASLSEVRLAAEKNIQEGNGSFQRFSGDGYVVVYPPNLKTLDERLDYAAEHFKNLRERAGTLLNPVQLAAYEEQQEEALRRLRRAMAATPALR
jgi:hypothetical protein